MTLIFGFSVIVAHQLVADQEGMDERRNKLRV